MDASGNDIFRALQTEHKEGKVTADISVNPNSPILKGHFPGHPVVPGACMLQVVKEVLERALDRTLQLKTADHLKFVSLIAADNQRVVQLEITYRFLDEDAVFLTSRLFSGENLYFKLQCTFVKM